MLIVNCRCNDLYKFNQVILFSPNYFVRSQCKRTAKNDALYRLHFTDFTSRVCPSIKKGYGVQPPAELVSCHLHGFHERKIVSANPIKIFKKKGGNHALH